MIVQNISIRRIKKTELGQLVKLCNEHAIFEGATYDSTGKEELLEEFIFGERPVLVCFVAVHEDELLGFISFTKEFSTWSAKFYYHMDCLYLKANSRKLGLGKQLMNAMIVEAGKSEIDHIQWQTPESNTNAIDFYHHMAASSKAKIRFFLDL